MEEITTIGLDIAKSVFQVHAVSATALSLFAGRLSAVIGMEACATAHHWGRELAKLGHEVRLMPPRCVKPYVKRNKNDMADAEAICEAVTRPEPVGHGTGQPIWAKALRARAFDRDLIRGEHYGQRPSSRRSKRPGTWQLRPATSQKTLANPEPSTHGPNKCRVHTKSVRGENLSAPRRGAAGSLSRLP